METAEGSRKVVVEGMGPERRWVVSQERNGVEEVLGSFPTEEAALTSRAMRTGKARWSPSRAQAAGAAAAAAVLAVVGRLVRARR